MLALGRLEDAVHEAERYTQRGTYLEPYAVRALALAGDEPALQRRAARRSADLD
jgi:hypothetical protein